jgi:hypothetical protein
LEKDYFELGWAQTRYWIMLEESFGQESLEIKRTKKDGIDRTDLPK